MLRPPPVNLSGKGASKGENEVEANSSTGHGTKPPSELVQEGVGEGPLKSETSSAELGLMRLKLSGTAAELLQERNSSSSVKKMVCISDH